MSYIVVCWFQNRPVVIQNEDLDGPQTWATFEEAERWALESGHIIVDASETITVLDCESGEATVV